MRLETGMKTGGLASESQPVGGSSSATMAGSTSFAYSTPVTSSSVSRYTGKRACSETRIRSSTSDHGVAASMPTMSTRGTMISSTVVAPSEKTPWISSSSADDTSASAATTSANCSADVSRSSSSMAGGG